MYYDTLFSLLDTPLFVLTNKQFFHFLDACCFQFAYWTTERWQKRSQYTYYNGLQGEFFNLLRFVLFQSFLLKRYTK